MKQNIFTGNKWIWYCLYAVILAIFFIYILFPSKDIREYLIRSAGNIHPDLVVSIKKVSPTLPPGIKIKDIRMSLRNNPEEMVFQSEQIYVRPKILSLITGNNKYAFKGRLYDGTVSGLVQSAKSPDKNAVEVRISMENISIRENSGFFSKISDRVEGALNGNITYRGRINNPMSGDGDAEITLSEGLFKMARPVLGLDEIEFSEFKMEGNLKENRFNITRGDLTGEHMAGSISGPISLNNHIPDSRLNLKAEIELHPSIFQVSPEIRDALNMLKKGMKDGKLSFNIKGTIEKPVPDLPDFRF